MRVNQQKLEVPIAENEPRIVKVTQWLSEPRLMKVSGVESESEPKKVSMSAE